MIRNIAEQLMRPKGIFVTTAVVIATGAAAFEIWKGQDSQKSPSTTPVPGAVEPLKTPSLYDKNYFKPPFKPSKKGTGTKSEIQKQWAQFSDQKRPR